MDGTLITNLLLIALLIALTAVFVGSEFAVIKIRLSRIDQLIAEGNKKAIIAKKLVQNLDYYLSACQLGITVTALALGWLGEPTVKQLLFPLFASLEIAPSLASVISFIVSFAVVTFLHVVVGELAPKTLAIQFPEKITLLLCQPLYWFGKLMAPLIWSMNGSAQVLLRLFGFPAITGEQAHSEDELKIIMTQSFNSGEINQTELSYMKNIFTFDERIAKDIMIPRIQVATIDRSMNREEIIATLEEYQFTRYPVTDDGDKDHVIGFVNIKEMFTNFLVGRENRIENLVHELPLILESTRLQDALLMMRAERVHIALVLDEYGGTSGIITMEDILEEIVGEIRDEFDANEIPDIQEQTKGLYHINGRVLLSDLERRFGMSFNESNDVDTIGGWIQRYNMHIKPNDSIDHGEYCWTVLEIDNHQIKQVELQFRNVHNDDNEN